MQIVLPMASAHMAQVHLLPSCSPVLLPTLWCRSSFLVFMFCVCYCVDRAIEQCMPLFSKLQMTSSIDCYLMALLCDALLYVHLFVGQKSQHFVK